MLPFQGVFTFFFFLQFISSENDIKENSKIPPLTKIMIVYCSRKEINNDGNEIKKRIEIKRNQICALFEEFENSFTMTPC